MSTKQINKVKAITAALVGCTIIIGGFVWAARNKKKKQELAANDFMQELERNIEPEKIDRALLSEAFSPSYWKTSKNKHSLITPKAALELAKQIYQAWNAGTFWDDLEEEVYRAFEDHRLKSFADVSKVADAYRSKQVAGQDLWKHLNDKLSKAEIAKVKQIVIQKQ